KSVYQLGRIYNRNSQFWKWLRENGGVDEEDSDSWKTHPLPSWISRSLDNPQRARYIHEIQQLHSLVTETQPTCQNVAEVGGIYNWKKNIMENEMTVCFDNDITPAKHDCTVYSFGLTGNDWTFEEEMQKMGCE
ncbi:hypothetical protein SK128_022369, partial [Halocaridina rubra]